MAISFDNCTGGFGLARNILRDVLPVRMPEKSDFKLYMMQCPTARLETLGRGHRGVQRAVNWSKRVPLMAVGSALPFCPMREKAAASAMR